MSVCQKCGADLSADASFCAACGMSLQPNDDPTRSGGSLPNAGQRTSQPQRTPDQPFLSAPTLVTTAPSPGPLPASYGAHTPPGVSNLTSSKTNGMAVLSAFLGLFWILGIGSVLAVLLGHSARHQIRENHQYGGSWAIAGLVLGYLGIAVTAGLIVTGHLFGY